MSTYKSPFKFPDSYTKDDREIFFGRDQGISGTQFFLEDFIPPFQGLFVFCCSYQHWTLSNADIFCAYSAKKLF